MGQHLREQQLRQRHTGKQRKQQQQQQPTSKEVTKESLVRHSLPFKRNDNTNELWRRKEAEEKYESEREQRLQTEQQVMHYEDLTCCLQEDLDDARSHAHAVEMVADAVAQEAAAEVERVRTTQLTRIIEDRNHEVEQHAERTSSKAGSRSSLRSAMSAGSSHSRASVHRRRCSGPGSVVGSDLSTPDSTNSTHSSGDGDLSTPMRLSDLDWVRPDRGNAENLCGLGGVSPAPGALLRGITPCGTPLAIASSAKVGRNIERLQVTIPGETIGEVAQAAIRERASESQPVDEPGPIKEMISGLAATIADKAVAQVQLERAQEAKVKTVPTPNARYFEDSAAGKDATMDDEEDTIPNI